MDPTVSIVICFVSCPYFLVFIIGDRMVIELWIVKIVN
jgi:hypothetical protein